MSKKQALSDQRMNELKALSVVELKERIVVASMQKEEARKELEANPEFQAVKLAKKDLESSLKDLNKELNAVIKASIQIIEEKGGA